MERKKFKLCGSSKKSNGLHYKRKKKNDMPMHEYKFKMIISSKNRSIKNESTDLSYQESL